MKFREVIFLSETINNGKDLLKLGVVGKEYYFLYFILKY